MGDFYIVSLTVLQVLYGKHRELVMETFDLPIKEVCCVNSGVKYFIKFELFVLPLKQTEHCLPC